MSLPEIYHQFVFDLQQFSLLEFISTILQLASVWYAKKNNILVYPTGIVGVAIAVYICFISQLYADSLLNIFYVVMSLYGWYHWILKKGESYKYPIQWCGRFEYIMGGLFFIIGWGTIYFVLKNYTNSNVPVLDSFVSSSAITAMWWMALRKIDNWIAWIISDLVAIPLFFYKHLVLFTLMYVLFLVLAIAGLLEWMKKYKMGKV
ncbi:MAG: nicotinamide mononucleotide transporter [Bacteroidetes bacterium]|nr:nicotinamide mononucleotide transporter [Bacteroidota bacterium]